MCARPTPTILDIPIQSVDRAALESQIRKALKTSKGLLHIVTINPEMIVEAHRNEAFRTVLTKTYNVVDGAGIQWMMRLLHGQKLTRIPGVEISEMVCRIASQQQKKVYFLGGYGVADPAAHLMQKYYPELQVAGTHDGDETTFGKVATADPDVLLIAFGAPKQEFWIAQNASGIQNLRVAVGVGGTFDFWAEKVHRAPEWMQRVGLEWLFRLIQEPRRIKRIYRAVILFPILALHDRFEKDA